MKHSFILDGAKILGEYWDGNTLIPLYDNEDNVCGILYGDIPYYFLKNLQGDVIAIVNESGTIVARYTYDAWGACTVSYDATATPTVEGGEAINIATVNPFRYRSYYFDTETGLYYLQSRYYDPALGRFINGDEAFNLGCSENIESWNSFAYCWNNPINIEDSTGCSGVRIIVPKNPIFSLKKLIAFSKKAKRITQWIINLARIAKCLVCGMAKKIRRLVNTAVSKVKQKIKTVFDSVKRWLKANIKKLNKWFKENVQITTYRGAPVLVLKCLGYNAFSFGIIVIGKDEYDSCLKGNSQTLEHEYGHILQMLTLGFSTYALMYALPSFIGFWCKVPYDRYYSQPWEYTADILGGANRDNYEYSENAAVVSVIYFAISLCFSYMLRLVT